MSVAKNPILLEDTFKVVSVNPDGRKYQRVSRIECRSVMSGSAGGNDEVKITVDINTDIYSVDVGQILTLAMATTLNLSGETERDSYDHSVYQRETVMSNFEYVMFGKVFKCNTDDANAEKSEVLLSFGGLLMKVEGTSGAIRSLKFNQNYYFMMKKTS